MSGVAVPQADALTPAAAKFRAVLREARPSWGPKDFLAAEGKLRQVGVRNLASLSEILNSEPGLNETLRQAGLKAFGSDTTAAFRERLAEPDIKPYLIKRKLEPLSPETPPPEPVAPEDEESSSEEDGEGQGQGPKSAAVEAYDVVHRVVGREARDVNARVLTVLNPGTTVRGRACKGWLELAETCAKANGVFERTCWVLIDATHLGHGRLLEPHDPKRIVEKAAQAQEGEPTGATNWFVSKASGLRVLGTRAESNEKVEREKAERRSVLSQAQRTAEEIWELDRFRLCSVYGSTQYGDWYREAAFSSHSRHRLPFGLLRGKLDHDVVEYLLAEAPFTAPDFNMEWLKEKFGVQGSDKPGEPTTFIKGDWYTRPSLAPKQDIFVPRLGCRGPARRATRHVMAFAEAFREVNAIVWSGIIKDLKVLAAAPNCSEELQGVCDLFRIAMEDGRHFGAAEVQHYSGDGFEGRLHIDGVTSALHLAVTLGGERDLLMTSSTEVSGAEADDVFRMRQGDAYLTSPSLFQHKVTFPSCKPENAAVSLHMRFLFEPVWWMKKYVNQSRDKETNEVAKIIAAALNQSWPVRLPSIGEVLQHEKRLEAILGTET
mmetsp:Transcript_96580/g.216299  ORF Transcript_96580/g.216299 Transcript_96580/m.216299 type:complete len:604 (-) Transcript_96580:197-2008(-)